MVSKKKRKSGAPNDEQPPKRPSSQQGRRGGDSSGLPLVWSADGVTVTLLAGQALLFVGRAELTVKSGEVAAFGRLLSAASGSAEVCADDRCGGALLLEPGAALGTVPLAASGAAVFSLTRAAGGGDAALPASTPLKQQQQPGERVAEVSSGGASASRRLGFEAWLAGEASAPPVAPPPPLPPLWQQAAAEVEEGLAEQAQAGGGPPIVVVCGAKKVGKSTFARLLVNSLLNRHPCVAYLDTDCGQPEFTAPGLISLSLLRQPLLGPPHMHQRRPAAAHFVGDTSPASNPVRYLQYIQQLYSWYLEHAAAAAAGRPPGKPPDQRRQLPPLIINTHGWVKGMGFDVLVELLQGLPISHMVQIAAANPKKNLPPGAFWLSADVPPMQQPHSAAATAAQPALWLLPGLGDEQAAPQPALSDTSARSAATLAPAASEAPGGGGGCRGRLNAVEQRGLQWEALAQQCIDCCGPASSAGGAAVAGGGKGDASAAAAAPGAGGELGDRLAAAVPYEVDLDGLEMMHSSVPPSQLCHALNSSVVGLCIRAPPGLVPAAPGVPPALPCLGLGIVRAADVQRQRLHILTAVPEEELESVAVLQLGRLELPSSLLQTAAHLSPYLALHSISSMGTGAGALKSRNNLLRKSQL